MINRFEGLKRVCKLTNLTKNNEKFFKIINLKRFNCDNHEIPSF